MSVPVIWPSSGTAGIVANTGRKQSIHALHVMLLSRDTRADVCPSPPRSIRMDADRFDILSRAFDTSSRRRAVRALGALSAVGLASRLGLPTTEAKKKKKKRDDNKQQDCPTCPAATTCPACAAGLQLRSNGTCARKTSDSTQCLGGAGCRVSDPSADDGLSQYCVVRLSTCAGLTQCSSTAQCPKGSVCVPDFDVCPFEDPYRC